MINETFEDLIKLQLPEVELDLNQLDWIKYNPRKDINRWGCSLTSLDGRMTGIPDLDSLYEYNKLNGTQYKESDFKTFTALGEKFKFLTEHFDFGRSHILKLGPGGYFPYHRDLGTDVFRLVYCIEGCHPSHFVWIQDDKVLKLQDRSWYYINTKKIHATFALNTCIFAVFNVINNDRAQQNIKKIFEVK